MANVSAPFGFAEYGRLGAAVNYQMQNYLIASTNTTAIYFGDPVQQATSTTGIGTGFIKQAAASLSWTITSLSWSAGVLTVTASGATVAPAVGSMLVASGFSTATAFNGVFGPVLSATTTTFTINFPVTQSTDTGTVVFYQPILGIFAGCNYPSVAMKKPFDSRYWPGTTDSGTANPVAKIIIDPAALFIAQSNTGGPVVQANVGQNINFTIGTGSTATGFSGAMADFSTIGAQPYLPFKIIGLVTSPPGAPGTDTATAFNWVQLAFNNQDFRVLGGN